MKSEEKKTTNEKGGFERYFQMVVGILMWAWLTYSDHISDIDWSNKTMPEWIFIGCKYAFAGMLISGVTPREIIAVIKAWKDE